MIGEISAILLAHLEDIKCQDCPKYVESNKEKLVNKIITDLKDDLINAIIPDRMDNKFEIGDATEKIAHVGGFNNCRALMIRNIRAYCKEVSTDKKSDIIVC